MMRAAAICSPWAEAAASPGAAKQPPAAARCSLLAAAAALPAACPCALHCRQQPLQASSSRGAVLRSPQQGLSPDGEVGVQRSGGLGGAASVPGGLLPPQVSRRLR
jgi:hypothetical protein